MNHATKGMTLIEVMMVMLIMSLLASIAMPMYGDYTKRSRTAEVPMVLKSLAQTQIGFYESEGHYATELLTLGWKTNNGLAEANRANGAFYFFSTAGIPGCDPGAGWAPVPDGLALATALFPQTVPDDQQAACMGADLQYLTNEPD